MFPLKLLIVAVLAHLPIVYVYSRTMWNQGHYQFFPLLFCAVGWLLYDRLSERKSKPGSNWLVVALFALNIFVLFATIAVYSPVFVIPAIVLLLCALVVDRYGLAGLWATLPVIATLLIVTRLPTGRDLVLINQMQFLASQLASWILDAFGLVHFREGVILVTEKKHFFTEEACSGIRSLFSTVAVVAIYGLVRRYALTRHLFNFAQSIVWVIVGNAIRVAAVVYLADNGYEQFSHGTLHDLFGLGIFCGIFGVTLSVDRALDTFYFAGPTDDDLEEQRSPPSEPVQIGVAVKTPRSKWVTFGLIGAYAVIFLFSARLTYAKRNNFDRIEFQSSEMVAVDESALPSVVGDLKLKGFETKLRTEASLFAPESYIWTYEREGLLAIVSLDSPYGEFHDLTLCYRGIGWDVKAHHEYQENSEQGISWLEMKKPSEYGRVYFAAYGRDGRLAQPAYQFSPTTRFRRNISLALGTLQPPSADVNRNGEQLPISQIQLMVKSDQPISDEDMQSCRDLFDFARSKLLQSKRFRQ